jgi:1-deoxy-D-xylulose-5-phosphate synthase
MSILDTIRTPADLKKLSIDELQPLADEVRQEVISMVSRTGGHLGSNLGSVELTVALHYVFDLPADKLIWDVSHQVYPHKLLTGRRDRMHTLRQFGGLAGFAKRSESEYDPFGAGHASTSISAALGFAAARDNANQHYKVVAVIGDGSMSGGLAFEALNNAGALKKDLLVVLNDNTWSISRNVGSMSKYLTHIMSHETVTKLRNEVWELTGKFKRREKIRKTISRIEQSVKSLLVPGMLFQELGFKYFGPLDGHDIPSMVRTLQNLKNLKGPVILHVATVKGKGYEPAMDDPFRFHGVGKFDKITGKVTSQKAPLPTYTRVYGDTMLELAQKQPHVVAITAAMASGTGLVQFGEQFPDRFFDVGIAEAHAVCFAAGLAAAAARPYVAIYSTFLQRAYDQIIHDVALQKLPVVFCLDRGGLVGEDGPTHHGVFDLTYLATVPDLTVAVPKDGNELRAMLHYTADHDLKGPVAIRYPRATIPEPMVPEVLPIEWGAWERLSPKADIAILAVGSMVHTARNVVSRLASRGISAMLVNARFVKPLDQTMLADIAATTRAIVTLEENALRGGFGQAVSAFLLSKEYGGTFTALGIPDEFVTHGQLNLLLQRVGLDEESIFNTIVSLAVTDKSNEQDETETRSADEPGFFQRLMLRRNGNSRKKDTAAK